MYRVSRGSRQPLDRRKQRRKRGFHWRLLLVFMFLGTFELFPVSIKASKSADLLPSAGKHTSSPSPVQAEDSRITVDSTGDRESLKKTAEETNSMNSTEIQDWLIKHFVKTTTPTETQKTSETSKKSDTAVDGAEHTERLITGWPPVTELQKLVDYWTKHHTAPPPEPSSPKPSPAPAIEVPYSTPEPEIEEPYSTPEPEIEEPYSTPEPEIEEPYSTPEPEIEEPYSTPEPEIEEPYSTPEPEIEEPYSTPEPEIEEPYSTPEPEIEEPYSTPEPEIEEPYSTPEPEIEEPYSTPEPGDSPSSAEAPEVDPPEPSTTPPSPSPPISSPRPVTLEDIKNSNEGVTIRVDGPKGKIGLLVPPGVTMKLKDAIIEVPDDIAVVIGVNGGNVVMKNVQLIFKQQPQVTRKSLETTEQSLTKQGLALTNESNADISNSRFQGSTDSMVSLEMGSILNCKGCVFHQNIAQERGGAIMAKGSSVILEDCAFSNNEAPNGGAVWMSGAHHGDEASYLKIRHSLFMYNKVDNEGGTLWVKNVHKVEVLDSRFSSGIGVNKGGALVVENTRDLRIVGSHFDNNEAKTSSGGAASLAFCSTIEILNSTFESNSALIGGSATIYIDARGGGQVNIKNTRFNENKAQSRGGAILLQTIVSNSNATSAYAHVSIDQSSFTGNTAVNGGAIYVSSESGANSNLNVEVKNTEFLQNSATNAGGGIYCGRQSSINFDSSVFQQNEAHTGKGCATACGCSIHRKQTDSLELQEVAGDSSSHCDSPATPATAGETSGSSNTLTYVMVVLAVMVALIIILVGVLSKNKCKFHFNRSSQLLRSLTSIDNSAVSPLHGSSDLLDETRVDLPSESSAPEASAGRWMGRYTYGEIDCPVSPRSTDLSRTGSVNRHFSSDPEDDGEARAAQTILMDDAFAMDR